MEDSNWLFLWSLSTYGILFFFGASLASFYTTLGERILTFCYGKKRKEFSGFKRWNVIFTKPSHCPSCGHLVTKKHLTPIFGWFFTKGKCFQCKTELPKLYPLSEFLFGIVAIFIYFVSEDILGTITLLFLLGHLLISMMTDVAKFSLDYENLPFLVAFGFLSNYLLFGEVINLLTLWVFLGFFVFYFLIYLLFRGGTGLGDVLFSPIFAAIAGNPFWILYFNSSYLLAVGFSFLLRKKGEPLKGKKIPMGLYFSLGLFLTYFAKLLVHYYNWEGFSIYGTIE
ncbi:prepilin peptidase [Leptospira terpstrae]|uniref:Peptidase A24, N-terminal domain protein n=1 Tax=Leptospira terpstrae serovar Hualin str. LT 11-33 = ATCC 700639 TaxID=1257025 RepID=N1VT53_9LEPT|nr:A24 family peptidase [Leptospira terpstrae]EMY61623.1 peptidase A24, N-terminal domain protein [Leptospira terpstrae serovar Hualin str. LT 11-33 = ATCC 700639]